jgi:hypothetical protein
MFGAETIENCMRLFNDIAMGAQKHRSRQNPLVKYGLDMKKITKNSLEIPEFTKAIRHSIMAEKTLKHDPIFKDVLKKDVVDIRKLRQKIFELENDIEAYKEYIHSNNRNRHGNTQNNEPNPEFENFNPKEAFLKLEKLMDLAIQFKKINEHAARKSFAEIGISNINMIGNRYFVEFENIRKILKITVLVGTVSVQFVDKVWKISNFKIHNAANDELSPLETIGIGNIMKRREKLIKRNVRIMYDMLRYIENVRPQDRVNADIVSNLLRGFYCKPSELRESIKYGENVKYELTEKMSKLYKF